MPRSLTASDRTSLIRLASSLPAGSAERKAILAGLQKVAFFERDVDPKAVLKYFSAYFHSHRQDPELYKVLKGDWDKVVSDIVENIDGDLDAISRKYRVPNGLAQDWKTLIRVIEDVLYR